MIISDVHWFEFLGQLAKMWVYRNNGDCWAEIDSPAGRFSVTDGEADHYERADEDCFKLFKLAAEDPRNVTDSLLHRV